MTEEAHSDIVKRLRSPVNVERDYFISQWPNEEPDTKDAVRFEAADEIEELRSKAAQVCDEVTRLRSALEGLMPFAQFQLSKMQEERNTVPITKAIDAARAALEGK